MDIPEFCKGGVTHAEQSQCCLVPSIRSMSGSACFAFHPASTDGPVAGCHCHLKELCSGLLIYAGTSRRPCSDPGPGVTSRSRGVHTDGAVHSTDGAHTFLRRGQPRGLAAAAPSFAGGSWPISRQGAKRSRLNRWPGAGGGGAGKPLFWVLFEKLCVT